MTANHFLWLSDNCLTMGGTVQQYRLVQFVGIASFLCVSAVALTLSSAFGGEYMVGLLLGFAVGLTVAVFEYGVVVETEQTPGGTISRKIDQIFE